MTDQIADLAQRCYDTAKETDRPTRDIARELIASAAPSLVAALAVEFLVGVVADAQRAATRDAERAAERRPTELAHESSRATFRVPRKGSKARDDWERNTEEGRAWALSEERDEMRARQMYVGVLGRAIDRYTEELHIQWTAELLDSGFSLRDGTLVAWGDATVDQHIERRQMFTDNAHANLEGAARHEIAIRELQASGAENLRAMVSAAA